MCPVKLSLISLFFIIAGNAAKPRFDPPLVATADEAFRLDLKDLFSKNRFHFGVKYGNGNEAPFFFEQNQLFNFLVPKNPVDISHDGDNGTFEGVTFGFRFDF